VVLLVLAVLKAAAAPPVPKAMMVQWDPPAHLARSARKDPEAPRASPVFGALRGNRVALAFPATQENVANPVTRARPANQDQSVCWVLLDRTASRDLQASADLQGLGDLEAREASPEWKAKKDPRARKATPALKGRKDLQDQLAIVVLKACPGHSAPLVPREMLGHLDPADPLATKARLVTRALAVLSAHPVPLVIAVRLADRVRRDRWDWMAPAAHKASEASPVPEASQVRSV